MQELSQFLDFFPENGTGYMVMEYLDGCTLEQYTTSERRLESSVALKLLIPVADALRACHAQGLIHRDISPDNIFLTSDNRVKLLDFGAARFALGAHSTNFSVILKEGYAPFEQYQRNGRQGPWTDVYALTATLYRLLTGKLPPTAPDRLGAIVVLSDGMDDQFGGAGRHEVLDKLAIDPTPIYGLGASPQRNNPKVDTALKDFAALVRASGGDFRRVALKTLDKDYLESSMRSRRVRHGGAIVHVARHHTPQFGKCDGASGRS